MKKQSKQFKSNARVKYTGRTRINKWLKRSVWARTWIRIGVLVLFIFAAGIALITVGVNNRPDSEPAVPVQGGQTQIPGSNEKSPESLDTGIKSIKESVDRQVRSDSKVSTVSTDAVNIKNKTNEGGKPEETVLLSDFPSPIKGPVLRKVGSYYSEEVGDYLFHAGTDYLQAEGAIIIASRGGTVIFAGPDPFLGQKVEIDCGEGWFVTYGCLDNLRVKIGDQIEQQAVLGQVALDGGPDAVSGHTQLHYEVRYEDEVIEPND